MSAKLKLILTAVTSLLLGAVLGFAARAFLTPPPPPSPVVLERRAGSDRFVNPLLECDAAGEALRSRELPPFQRRVEALVQERTARPGTTRISVYFRELNDGQWFSIGESEKFVPASLRKVPLMLALLKSAETTGGKAFLDRPVTFDLGRDYTAQQNIKPGLTLVPGESYRVRDLIERMIVYSDNNAFTLLAGIVDPIELQSVYATLRMQNPLVPGDDEFLSIQTYASFFRVLYNATYLSKAGSEWALGLLARAEFRAGLVAGVPPQVPVAHKFGEHSDPAAGTVQLHDCGIVYHPRRPYLLCVMSRGTRFDVLDDDLVAISRLVYSVVDEQR